MMKNKNMIPSLIISAVILTASLFVRVAYGSVHTDSHVSLSGNPLLVSNRDDLAFCIDVVGDEENVSPEGVANQVTSVLTGPIKLHPRWTEMGYDKFSVRVMVGCSGSAYLLQPGASHPILSPNGESEETPVPIVDTPSSFRVHVYIVSQKVVEDVFGSSDIRSAPQEMLCEGNQCFEVTSAIYLTPQEVSNLPIVRDRIERVLAINLVDIMGGNK